MKNGMDSFFNLGAYRRCLWYCLAVVAFTSSAEFTDSDSEVLSTINERLSQLYTIRYLLSDGPVGSDLHAIRQYQSTINNEIISIDDYVSGINSVISRIHFIKDSVDVQDTRLRNTVEESNSELQALNRKFDTFLDYYSNNLSSASSSIDPWVYTNLIFFADPYVTAGTYSDPINAITRRAFRQVLGLGNDISDAEIDLMISYHKGFGSWIWHYFDVWQLIDPEFLPPGNNPSRQSYNEINNFLASKAFTPGLRFREIAPAYYYQYGTRELTATNQAILEALYSISNSFSSGSFSALPYTLSEQDTNSIYSSGFQNVVTGLAGSIRPSVESDLQKVNTNDIENIENTQYSAFIRTIAQPDDEMVSGFEDEIRRFVSDMSGQLDNFQQVQDITVDFGTFSLFEVSQPLSFKISRPGVMYWNVLHYCATFLRVAICSWWAIAIWSFVSSSKTQGALE